MDRQFVVLRRMLGDAIPGGSTVFEGRLVTIDGDGSKHEDGVIFAASIVRVVCCGTCLDIEAEIAGSGEATRIYFDHYHDNGYVDVGIA